jgi:hypothetical protein
MTRGTTTTNNNNKNKGKAEQQQMTAGKRTEEVPVAVEPKVEFDPFAVGIERAGGGNNMNVPVANDAAKPGRPRATRNNNNKDNTDNKDNAGNKMDSANKGRAIEAAPVLRLADNEHRRANDFTRFVGDNAGDDFKPVPLLAIDAYNRQKSKKTIYVLSFVWDEDGERTRMYFARCEVVDHQVGQPDEAPEDEPDWVSNNVDATKPNNLLVLVKNVDDNGLFTASPFHGHSKSVLVVSPGLLFYMDA